MDTIFTKGLSWGEREAAVAKAVQEFDQLGEFSFLIAPDNVTYAAAVRASIPLLPVEPIAPRPMTAAEANELDRELAYKTLYGYRADDDTEHLSEPFATQARLHAAEEFFELTAPVRAAERQARDMIRAEVATLFAKTAANDGRVTITTRTSPGRVTIGCLSKAADADDSGSPLAKLLRSFAAGAEKEMRATVRAMIA